VLKKTKIIISIFMVITLTACSHKYSFEIDAPPKYSSQYVFKSMQIKGFESSQSAYQQSFINMLKTGIANEGYIKIIDQSGESLLSGVLHIGKVLKGTETSSYECERNKVKTTCYNHTHRKKHLLKVDYSISTKDNSIIFGESLSEEFDDSWYSSESQSAARGRAKTDEEIISKSLKTIAQKIVKAVSPHKETVSRELQDGDSDSVELGITYVENGRVEQALSIWDQCISKSDSTEEKAAAYYNIGVIKESQGNYRDAFDIYSKANTLLPKEELYIKAMTRSEKLNTKVKAVREWKQIK
jgi:tetratricopeptide (TPR) repeat protein